MCHYCPLIIPAIGLQLLLNPAGTSLNLTTNMSTKTLVPKKVTSESPLCVSNLSLLPSSKDPRDCTEGPLG